MARRRLRLELGIWQAPGQAGTALPGRLADKWQGTAAVAAGAATSGFLPVSLQSTDRTSAAVLDIALVSPVLPHDRGDEGRYSGGR